MRITLGFLDRITGLSGLTRFLESENPVNPVNPVILSEVIGKWFRKNKEW
jgi:hypothetical protein